MTIELNEDLINFSFNDLHDVFKNHQRQHPYLSHCTIFHFLPPFLECLKELVCHHSPSFVLCILVFTHFMIQPLFEADHICQTFQVPFDRILCDLLGKHRSSPRFTLLLGSLLHTKLATLAFINHLHFMQDLINHLGDRHIINDSEFPRSSEYAAYLMVFLESPERSGTHFFDEQRYAAAAKGCLQLCLCSRHNFSKGVTKFACRDKAMRRSKPWEWVARLGLHSRIRKGRHRLKVRKHKLLKGTFIVQFSAFPPNSPDHQYYRSLSYRWTLDLLPFLLERSAISLELTNVLHSCTFTTMAWKFPRRMRLAKESIAKYLLRVESAASEA